MARNGFFTTFAKTAPLLAGLAIFLLVLTFTVNMAQAQDRDVPEDVAPGDCASCHLNVARHWEDSPHAHAFDDPIFQEWWQGQGTPGECLTCHTTGYDATTGTFSAEGITCEACHGAVNPDHPPAPIPLRSDTEYCGACHTPTHSEWRLSGHGASDIGCVSCHDPHSQLPIFPDTDQMCINCHQDDMGDYLEDLHIMEGIGCVDCHMLVIPPDEMPIDGLVPTGHQFNITPATCVACHTDALHAGFSLPGWERGANAVAGEGITPTLSLADRRPPAVVAENGARLEQQVQALEAALASRTMTILFQGGIIGLVLGGTTAWLVAHNVRRREEDDKETSEA